MKILILLCQTLTLYIKVQKIFDTLNEFTYLKEINNQEFINEFTYLIEKISQFKEEYYDKIISYLRRTNNLNDKYLFIDSIIENPTDYFLVIKSIIKYIDSIQFHYHDIIFSEAMKYKDEYEIFNLFKFFYRREKCFGIQLIFLKEFLLRIKVREISSNDFLEYKFSKKKAKEYNFLK